MTNCIASEKVKIKQREEELRAFIMKGEALPPVKILDQNAQVKIPMGVEMGMGMGQSNK